MKIFFVTQNLKDFPTNEGPVFVCAPAEFVKRFPA